MRYYDLYLARWTSRDPIGEAGGLNLYSFVGNDPINKIDPFGLYESHWLLQSVPGQHFWDRAITSFENRQYGQSAVYLAGMVAEQFLFVYMLRPTISVAPEVSSKCVVDASKSGAWQIGPGPRGEAIEKVLGQNLPSNYPVIDKFQNGLATSIKSMDLGSKTYLNPNNITNVGQSYIDKVAGFQGRNWAGVNIRAGDITGRALELAVPSGANASQRSALQGLVQYGQKSGVNVNIITIP